MFFLTLLTLLLFCLVPCELKIDSKRHPRNEVENENGDLELADKYSTFLSYAESGPLFTLDTLQEFSEFIISTPRNYSTVLIFNDIQKSKKMTFKSQASYNIHHNFELIASSYMESLYSSPRQHPTIFFVEILKVNMGPLFDRLEVKKIPAVIYVPPEGKLSNLQRMDDKLYPYRDSAKLLNWIEARTGVKIQIETSEKQTDLFRYVAWIVVVLTLISYINSKEWNSDSLRKMVSSNHSAYFGLSLTIILVSGHVYNLIEVSRFSIPTQNGEMFIYPARRVQLQAEAFIVSFVYFMFAVGLILLIEGRRLYMENSVKNRGRIFSVFGMVACSVSYFLLNSLYFKKMGN